MPKRSNKLGKQKTELKQSKNKKNEAVSIDSFLAKERKRKKNIKKLDNDYIFNYRSNQEKTNTFVQQVIKGKKSNPGIWMKPDNLETLKEMKQRLQSIIEEANRRVWDIQERGLYSYAEMKAYDEAGTAYFDISKKRKKETVLEEIARARDFLQDYTSTIEGAKMYDSEYRSQQYIEQFGKQWAESNNGKTYNTNIIDEEMARKAFKVYRKLEEELYDEIKDFGSDKMIAYAYSLVDEGYEEEEATSLGAKFLKNKFGTQKELLHEAFEKSNEEKKKADLELFRWRHILEPGKYPF